MTDYFPAPKKFRTEDGRVIIGFDKLSLAEQHAYGYEPVPVPAPADPVPPSPEQIQAETKQAIQDMLDNKAKDYEFDSIHTAGIWRGLRPHAEDLVLWGAACWNKAGEIRAAVMAGERSMPTPEQVLAEMPEFQEAS
ncbi:hypothetical protein [Desulfotignum balticum]|uniref:hypothetical protein n=1 Tax=Desulfotignum balticum TaxID=115781 RepID=UPI0004277FB3|nr:hypothetical protein [Desulfotignum balticum]